MSETPRPLLKLESSDQINPYWELAIAISNINHKPIEENLHRILDREKFINSQVDPQLPNQEQTSIILDNES